MKSIATRAQSLSASNETPIVTIETESMYVNLHFYTTFLSFLIVVFLSSFNIFVGIF